MKNLMKVFIVGILLTFVNGIIANNLSPIIADAYGNQDKEEVKKNSNYKSLPIVIGPTLYNQMGELSSSNIANVEYLDPTWENFNGYVVDDFEVPVGESWSVKYLRSVFYSSAGLDSLLYYNVVVYNNVNGSIGTEVKSLTEQTPILYDQPYENGLIYEVTIELTELIELNDGKYWLSIQPVTNATEGGRYNTPVFWTGQMLLSESNAIGYQAKMKNSYLGFSNYVSLSDYFMGYAGYDKGLYNLSFAMYGTEKNHDLNIAEIISPTSTNELSNHILKVKIQNNGLQEAAASTFNIKYRIDGGTYEEEVVGVAIPSGSEIIYETRQALDFSAVGTHTIDAEIIYNNDENLQNNSLSTEIENYGKLYVAHANTKVIYTIDNCEGTVTDHGGLGDITTSYSKDTIVLLPSEAGKRIRLKFFETNMYGAKQFQFFNNETGYGDPIDMVWAAEIGGYIIEGVNLAGAITIVAPDMDAENAERKNWMANISCVSHETNDFEVQNIEFNKQISWEQETIEITASILNKGTIENSVLATFFVDDVALGTVSSTISDFGSTGKLKINWTPPAPGIYNIKVTVPDDAGQFTEENEFVVHREIFEMGTLIESFEENKYPPEGWISKVRGGASVLPIWYNSREQMDGIYYVSFGYDTLITPKLNITNTDTLKFIYSTAVLGGSTEIVYSSSINGPWTHYSSVDQSVYFTDVKIPLAGIPEGEYYLGIFGSGSTCMMDYIRGPKIAFEQNNLVAINFDGKIDPQVGIETPYEIKVRSMGTSALTGSEYSVKLWKNTDGNVTELQALPGVALTQSNYHTFTFNHTFTTAEAAELYATIEFADDTYITDNFSDTIDIQVIADNLAYILHGDVNSDIADRRSLHTLYANYTENIYFKDSLNFKGEITGISVQYQNKSASGFPLKLYMGETDANNVQREFLSTQNMDIVFDDFILVDVSPHEFRTLYIPFEKPYLYSGEKNLVMAYYRPEQEGRKQNIDLQATNIEFGAHRSYAMQSYEVDVDVSDPVALANLRFSSSVEAYVPNVTFYTDTVAIKSALSGTVADIDNVVLPGVEMSLSKYANTTFTGTDGTYMFPVMPYGNVDVTAVLYGYYDSTQVATLSEGNESVVDFKLNKLPLVTVTGTVVGNDSLLPISGVEVIIEGYEINKSVFTNDKGVFTITDILGDQDYTLTFNHRMYVSDTLTKYVNFDGLDLNNVVLDEIEQAPFNVIATYIADSSVNISWQTPYSGYEGLLDPTKGRSWDYYWYNEVDEDVKLGNLFKVDKPGTVTSVEIWNAAWKDIINSRQAQEGDLYIRIYSKDRQEIIGKTMFTMPDTNIQWLNIDVPDFSYTDDFYVMIHWPGLHQQTSGIRYHYIDEEVENVAYIVDEAGNWKLISEEVDATRAGAFSIRANILREERKATKGLVNYNIWRSKLENSTNPAEWTLLNSEAILSSNTTTNFVDNSFTSAAPGYYIYMVQADYTLDKSPYAYSNVIDKGLYAKVVVNVTANNGENIDGTIVNLQSQTTSYTDTVKNGSVYFPRMLKSTYRLTADKGAQYFVLTQSGIEVNNDSVTLQAELIERLYAPENLMVVSDTANNRANFSWSTGTEIKFKNDNNNLIYGTAPNLGYNVGIGNFFETVGSGEIQSVEILGLENNQNENGEVRIVIYDAAQTRIYESEPFVIEVDQWMTIPIPTVEYSGSFYAMVEWSAFDDRYTHLISFDNSEGCHDGFIRDDVDGFVGLSFNGMPVAFGVRVNARVGGKKSLLVNNNKYGTSIEMENNTNITYIEKVEENSVNGVNEVNSAQSFEIYLDNNVVASGVSEKQFVFTQGKHLTKEGLATYKAGVKAIYTTGESIVKEIEFEYYNDGSVGIPQLGTNIALYPNPASTEVTISNCMNASIVIYNTLGVLVYSDENISNNESINVSGLTEGTYIVKVKIAEGSLHKSLIISK